VEIRKPVYGAKSERSLARRHGFMPKSSSSYTMKNTQRRHALEWYARRRVLVIFASSSSISTANITFPAATGSYMILGNGLDAYRSTVPGIPTEHVPD